MAGRTLVRTDTEYIAMRRRMSRLRVQCGKHASYEAEDIQTNDNDSGFKDLVKFWKKHGIPIAKDLLSDMDEGAARAAARRRGRRRSKELEDLHMSSSTGHLKLNHVTVTEEQNEDEDEAENKMAAAAIKPKTTSVNAKKPFKKAQSDFVLTKSKASVKQSNGLNSPSNKKLERQSSKK